jgi:hypothetical protein
MSIELLVAIIGFFTAVAGVVAALIKRRSTVVHHHETARPNTPESEREEKWKYCPDCGHWDEWRAQMACHHCGAAPLPRLEAVTVRELKCGHFMPLFYKHCAVCGEKARPRE